MKAKNREHYISEWKSHVNQLIYPFLDSGTQHSKFERMKGELMEVVEGAADQLFPGEIPGVSVDDAGVEDLEFLDREQYT